VIKISQQLLFFEIAYFSLVFTGIAIATFTDLKERIIPNKLTYSMIAVGLLLHLAESILLQNFNPILFSAIITVATFGGSWLLWKAGVWAGGDVKLFTGIAALLPYLPSISASSSALNFLPQELTFLLSFVPLTLFVLSIFSALPYGVLISIHAISKKREFQKQIVQDFKKRFLQTAVFSFLVAGLSFALVELSIPDLLLLPVLIVTGFIPAKARKLGAIVLFAAAVIFQGTTAVIAFFSVLIPLSILYALIKLFLVSRKALKEEVKISEIEEGTIPAETILEVDGVVKRVEGISIKTIINNIKNNKMQEALEELVPKGREIVSAKKARGVTDEEIAELKKLVKEGKIEPVMKVKKSMPFVPTVLIGFIVLIAWVMLFG